MPETGSVVGRIYRSLHMCCYQNDGRTDKTIQETTKEVQKFTRDKCEGRLLKEKGKDQEGREWPANNGSDADPHDSGCCARPETPVNETCQRHVCRQHGKAGRQKSNRGIENTGAERSHDQINNSNPGIQASRNGGEQACFRRSTEDGKDNAKKVELERLGPAREEIAQLCRDGMDDNVKPASEREFRRIFPRLETGAMIEVM